MSEGQEKSNQIKDWLGIIAVIVSIAGYWNTIQGDAVENERRICRVEAVADVGECAGKK